MLDLQSPVARWEKLSLSLPLSGCDIGCVPVKNDQILVFGGWNKTAQKGVYLFTRRQMLNQSSLMTAAQGIGSVSHDLNILPTTLETPDFFLVNGIAMKTSSPDVIQLAGHTQMF